MKDRGQRTVWGALPVVGLLLLSGGTVRASTTATLNLSTQIVAGTCTFVLPETVSLGNFVPADFTDNNGTVRVQPFDMTLKDCSGPSGSAATPGVIFGGTTLDNSQGMIFNDAHNGQAGFMFKEGHYAGSLANYKAAIGTVKSGDISAQSQFKKGEVPADGKVVQYSVGFVSEGGQAPAVADVNAVVSFQMAYR